MNKYDKMISVNRQKSEDKISRAKQVIYQMLEEKEKITVPQLMAKTGLSRGFFYKNITVRNEIERAAEQQTGLVDPRKNILNMAMNNELELLRKQLEVLRKENEQLKNENARIKKALNRKNLDLLKNL